MRLLILDLGMYIIELSEIFLIKLSYSFRKENNICQCIFLGGRTGNIGAIYCHQKKKKKKLSDTGGPKGVKKPPMLK
jgi:hypothetical protein